LTNERFIRLNKKDISKPFIDQIETASFEEKQLPIGDMMPVMM
jgi:hypothetical protein